METLNRQDINRMNNNREDEKYERTREEIEDVLNTFRAFKIVFSVVKNISIFFCAFLACIGQTSDSIRKALVAIKDFIRQIAG